MPFDLLYSGWLSRTTGAGDFQFLKFTVGIELPINLSFLEAARA
jgi:hypothetical protein